MQLTESPRAEGIRRLYELMLRVNSSTDLSEVLDEIARGVVEVEDGGFVLFGVAGGVSISKLFLAGIFPGLISDLAESASLALYPGG